jgi:hypothetical protein
MTTANELPRLQSRKPLNSMERAKLRVMPPTKKMTMNLLIEMARAKGDPVATARLLAALDGGTRPICQV